MKINFIIQDIGKNGGWRDIAMVANILVENGHHVKIIYPKFIMPNPFMCNNILMFLSKIKRLFISPSDRPDFRNWIKLKAKLVKVPIINNNTIPNADIIIATWWETAYQVRKLNSKKGKKFYFIQHYEIWGGNPKKVKKTYKMGLNNLVHSSWLKKLIPDSAIISHAPDQEIFYYEKDYKNKTKKINVMLFDRQEKWKATKDGINAFNIAKKEIPELNLILVKDVFDSDKLRHIYNFADIFLFPSLVEGLGLPPMEAMCCKCAVVTTSVGAVPDYCINNKNSLICKPRDINALANKIILLAKNKSLRLKIAQNGHDTIKKLTWKNQVKKMEKLFND